MKTSELHLLASSELAMGLSKNVKGLEGFYSHFLQDLSAPERKLINRWNRAMEAERKKLIEEIKSPDFTTPLPPRPLATSAPLR